MPGLAREEEGIPRDLVPGLVRELHSMPGLGKGADLSQSTMSWTIRGDSTVQLLKILYFLKPFFLFLTGYLSSE